MQKTRMGIKVGLLAAAIYFMGIFGGYIIAIILAGYVLLFEENIWLKRNAIKAVAVMICFSIVVTVIGFIPDIVGFLDSIVSAFHNDLDTGSLSNIISAIQIVIGVFQKILFIVMGIKALSQSEIPISFIDRIINNYLEK